MEIAESGPDRLLLRADERSFRVSVTPGDGTCDFIGWEVADGAALTAVVAALEGVGVEVTPDPVLAKDRSVTELVCAVDPAGTRVTEDEVEQFFHDVPEFERMLVRSGIILMKYWFSVSDEEQERRFRSRASDPTKRWKLSDIDLASWSRWQDYSRAKDEMFVHTDIPEAPWYVVESDDKRSARINMIAHLLSTVPYAEVRRAPVRLPQRPPSSGYVRPPRDIQTYVPDHAATVHP
jgi:hypothetical protein